ncbi:MAG: DUF2997 domain-containing protein [Anaerolineae bacterium]|nr:DUF2997 domain-containing protein [Anaerolineae bacterium]
MGPEEIEFIIMPDGTVREEVRGVQGTGCENVTRAIEDALGEVSEREHKPEYYEQTRITDSQTVSTGSG